MATASNGPRIRQEPQKRASGAASESSAPLSAIPFPAALVNPIGGIIETNSEWQGAHPRALPGGSCFHWCEEFHEPGDVSRGTLATGIRRVLSGLESRFTHDYGPEEGRKRIVASACPAGALIVHQCNTIPGVGSDGSKWHSHRMEAVGRLVGGVTHDFANILTLIAGYSDILLSRIGEKDPLRPELDEIRKAASRGAGLTGQLLGFTRGQTVQAQPIDLNGLIMDMQRMLHPIIGENVEVETLLSPDLGRVLADPGQMEQVIMNLILNARDAMPAGGRILIETLNSEMGESTARAHTVEPGPCVLLSIKDSGHGIRPEAIQHVFKPFFTTKQNGRGTGLGLSTVYNIVRQSRGDVWVTSAPGEGACFTICLPLVGGPDKRSEAAAAISEKAGSETVLLVEDEESVRRLLTHVLRKRGYQVLEASNGEEALGIFERRGPDIHLVLTDMVMPQMSGRELGNRLRQLRPELKVIYMSGYTDDVLVGMGALGGGMAFLQKPLRPEVLSAKVREALDSPSRPFNPG